MPARRISFAQLPDFYRRLARSMPEAAKTGALAAALRGQAYLVDQTSRLKVVDRGRYRQGWKGVAHPLGGRLYNDAPYAGVIEEGRRPGRFPPVDVMQRWVQRRLGGRGLSRGDVKSVAFLVSRKIAREGIPGKYVLRDALPAIQRFLDEEVQRALDRVIKRTS